MSSIRSFRAFSVELVKQAMRSYDADTQALLSERRGEEYLEGGKLLSNTAAEAKYVVKLSFDDSTRAGLIASDIHNLSAKRKKNNKYQVIRDYAGTGIKGGLTGVGALGALNMMRGKAAPDLATTARSARNWFGAGSGIALADRAYRYNDLPSMDKNAAAVSTSGPGNLRSPASQLAQARQTGGFRSRIIRRKGKPPKILQLGKKFKVR